MRTVIGSFASAVRGPVLVFVCMTLASCEGSGLNEADAAQLRTTFPTAQSGELAIAVAEGDVAGIVTLVQQGVAVDTEGQFGTTPLMVAIEFEQPQSISKLLELGADPNHTTDMGWVSPMHMSLSQADTQLLQELLDHGGDPNFGQDDRNPLVVQVSDAGRPEFVTVLVDAGANIDARGLNDDTAVIAAARRANYSIVLYLLERGADYSLTNRADESLVRFIEVNFYRNLDPDVDYREQVIAFLRAQGEELEPWEIPPE